MDDISESFKEPNIDKIRIDNYDGYSIIRVEFDDNSSDIKYSHNLLEGIMKDNEPIHENNNTVDQHFNNFENSSAASFISKQCEGTLTGKSIALFAPGRHRFKA